MTNDDLRAHLFEAGLLQPNDVHVAAIASGMVRQIVRSSMSMTVEDAESLVRHANVLAKDARKRGDADDLAAHKRSERTARAFLRFRKELEGLRE